MKKLFENYFRALNNHNIDKILGFYDREFELHFTGSDFTINRSGMRDVLGWDKGVNGKVSHQDLRFEGNSVSGIFIEENDFFRLIGIRELKSQNKYIFNKSGLIVKQTYKMLPDQPSFQEKMQPAIEWARENKPEVLKEIYPGNQIQYNEEMGKRWVTLLTIWNEAEK